MNIKSPKARPGMSLLDIFYHVKIRPYLKKAARPA